MRTLLLLAAGCLVIGCSSGSEENSGALKPPPAPNTSTAPGIADPNKGVAAPAGAPAPGGVPMTPGTPGAQMPTPGATGG